MKINRGSDSIKKKVFLIVIVVASVFFVIQALVYFGVFKSSIEKQEQFYAVKVAAKVSNIIDKVNDEVVSLCIDWSAWDSMYNAVVNGWTKKFEAEAFPPNSSFLFDINFVGILKNHKYLFFRNYKSGLKKQTNKEFFLPCEIMDRLVKKAEKETFDTFVDTSEGIMFVCVSRITTSDGNKESDGYLVMARFMSDFIWDKISNIILEDISFIRDKDFLKKQKFKLVEFHKIYLRKHGKHMSIVFDLSDFEGNVLGFVKIEIRRQIFTFFYKSTMYSVIITLITFLFLMVILTVFFEKTVLSRIRTLSEKMNTVELGKEPDLDLELGEDEIGVLEKNFVNMVQRINSQEKEKDEMMEKLAFFKNMATAGKITYHIIHEINNPIRVIKNCLYALENDKENYQEYYDLLKKEVNRLAYITQEMLDFSSSKRLVMEKIDISFLIKDVVKTVKTAYRDSQVEIDTVFLKKDRKLITKGDLNKLKQVFINIIRNGLEACQFKSPITISVDVDQNNDRVVISVCDLGEGIEQAKIERLFEPFYSNKEKGLGLGLSIAYNIIRNHNGLINVKPNKPKGTCFEIILPLIGDENET